MVDAPHLHPIRRVPGQAGKEGRRFVRAETLHHTAILACRKSGCLTRNGQKINVQNFFWKKSWKRSIFTDWLRLDSSSQKWGSYSGSSRKRRVNKINIQNYLRKNIGKRGIFTDWLGLDSSSQSAEAIVEVAGNSGLIKLPFKIIYVKRSEKKIIFAGRLRLDSSSQNAEVLTEVARNSGWELATLTFCSSSPSFSVAGQRFTTYSVMHLLLFSRISTWAKKNNGE